MVDSDVCQRPVRDLRGGHRDSAWFLVASNSSSDDARPSAGKRRGFDPYARHQVDRFRFPLRWGRYSQMR